MRFIVRGDWTDEALYLVCTIPDYYTDEVTGKTYRDLGMRARITLLAALREEIGIHPIWLDSEAPRSLTDAQWDTLQAFGLPLYYAHDTRQVWKLSRSLPTQTTMTP